jgi:hypothetical protein
MSKKKEELILIHTFNLKEIEKLNEAINNFRQGYDAGSIDDETIEVEFYDNGRIYITGEFKERLSQEITI